MHIADSAMLGVLGQQVKLRQANKLESRRKWNFEDD